jgi:hypothetical protein
MGRKDTSKAKDRGTYRDAKTGRFVLPEFAKSHPKTTVHESPQKPSAAQKSKRKSAAATFGLDRTRPPPPPPSKSRKK